MEKGVIKSIITAKQREIVGLRRAAIEDILYVGFEDERFADLKYGRTKQCEAFLW